MNLRAQAIDNATRYFDDGRFLQDLARRVGFRTVSQDPSFAEHLSAYLKNEIAPSLEDVFVTLTADAERNRARGNTPLIPVSPGLAQGDAPPARGDGPVPRASPGLIDPLAGFLAIFIKEFSHLRRQRSTLFFALAIPVMQTLIFGYALKTQIDNIPTVVFDLDGRSASREHR